MVKKDPEIIHWFNKTLAKCVTWQDDPLIFHEEVKLSGAVDIFYPTWAKGINIKNDITLQQLKQIKVKK